MADVQGGDYVDGMGAIGAKINEWGSKRKQRHRVKGNRAEDRVVKVCKRERRPWWLLSACRTKRFSTLDVAGVDVVVTTADVGDLWLQVKSSAHGAEKFMASNKESMQPIGLVVALTDDDDNTLYGKVLGALILLYERAEQARETSQ